MIFCDYKKGIPTKQVFNLIALEKSRNQPPSMVSKNDDFVVLSVNFPGRSKCCQYFYIANSKFRQAFLRFFGKFFSPAATGQRGFNSGSSPLVLIAAQGKV